MGLIGTGRNPGRDHVTSLCATLWKQAEQRAKCPFSIWLGWLIFNNCFHTTHEADLHSAFFVIYLQVLALQHVLYVTLCMVTCACSCVCTSICMCMHVFACVHGTEDNSGVSSQASCPPFISVYQFSRWPGTDHASPRPLFSASSLLRSQVCTITPGFLFLKGLERWLRGYGHVLLLQRTWVLSPASSWWAHSHL